MLQRTFACNQGGVLSLIARSCTVYAGCQDGCVAVWDLETGSLVRLIFAQEVLASHFASMWMDVIETRTVQNSDVLSMSMVDTDLYTCSAKGWVQVCVCVFSFLTFPLMPLLLQALVRSVHLHCIVACSCRDNPLVDRYKHSLFFDIDQTSNSE